MQRFWTTSTALVVSAGLQTSIFPVAGPLPYWRAQLAFIALVPWLWLLLRTGTGSARPVLRGALLSYGCGVLWYAGNCYWIYQTMHLYGGLSTVMAAVVLVLFCLYLGLYHALFGAAAMVLLALGRLRHLPPLLLALLWIGVEYARAHVTSFPWNLLGYSQIDNAALTRLSPWTGVYGISFLVALANAAIACGMSDRRSSPRRARVELSGGIALAALCLVLGSVIHTPLPTPTQTAVLVQPDLSAGADSAVASTPLEDQLAQLTTSAIRSSTGQGAVPHLLLWPEAPTSYEMHQARLQSVVTNLAAQHNSTVLVDANAADPDGTSPRHYRLYNAAGLFTAQGLHARYEKIHLVPFGEFVPYASVFSFAGGLTEQVGTFDHGTRRMPLSDGVHRYGVFICYESIFPDEVRQLAAHGADVLINLSDDGWYGDTSAPFQHSNMARMRAMENRRWLLRDTNTGITESIDPYGSVRETAPRHQRLAAVMSYSYATDRTFYTRHGDWFAWICTALSGVGLVYAFSKNERTLTR